MQWLQWIYLTSLPWNNFLGDADTPETTEHFLTDQHEVWICVSEIYRIVSWWTLPVWNLRIRKFECGEPSRSLVAIGWIRVFLRHPVIWLIIRMVVIWVIIGVVVIWLIVGMVVIWVIIGDVIRCIIDRILLQKSIPGGIDLKFDPSGRGDGIKCQQDRNWSDQDRNNLQLTSGLEFSPIASIIQIQASSYQSFSLAPSRIWSPRNLLNSNDRRLCDLFESYL